MKDLREQIIELILDYCEGATDNVADGVMYKELADEILALFAKEQEPEGVTADYMQMRDLTDEEWLALPKEEILQLYKNCYGMLMQYAKSKAVKLREELIKFLDFAEPIYWGENEFSSYRQIIDEYLNNKDK